MSTTVDYMCMAINRFVDYSKSACGIKLIPTLVSFNTGNCLKQMFERIHWEGANPPDVAPFPIDFPENCVTDISWFKENLFCLLSNANKYSDVNSNVVLQVKMIDKGEKFTEYSVIDSGTFGVYMTICFMFEYIHSKIFMYLWRLRINLYMYHVISTYICLSK
jgi:hypothetical protein